MLWLRNLAVPQRLRNILRRPDVIHLQISPNGASSALLFRRKYRAIRAVSKKMPLGLGHIQGYIPGSGSEAGAAQADPLP